MLGLVWSLAYFMGGRKGERDKEGRKEVRVRCVLFRVAP